jgi:Protein of unknown function (DUF2971)
VGALETFLDRIPDTFDVSAFFSPDVEKTEKTAYPASLIYKYFGSGRRHFFHRPQLRFSQREALNDPFEMTQRWNEVRAHGLRRYASDRLHAVLPKVFSNTDLHLACLKEHCASEGMTLSPDKLAFVEQFLTSDAGRSFLRNQTALVQVMIAPMLEHVFSSLEMEFTQLVENVTSKMGVLSLTEDPFNHAMWAHYASGGAGFIIGFDARHDFFVFRDDSGANNLLRKVIYTDDRLDNFWRNPYYLFLVKSTVWSYEREWRMLRELAQCDDRIAAAGSDVCLWNIPADAIKAVYFGYGYEAVELRQNITQITNFGANPEFYTVQVNRRTGLLEPQRISK